MNASRFVSDHPRLVRATFGVVIAGLVAGILGLIALAYLYSSVELPREPPLPQASIAYDAKGKEIGALSGSQNRTSVSLGEVSQTMRDAVVSSEDHGFYDHQGVSVFGIARAATNNLRGGSTQGGSTITQQLVKNSYLTSERTMTRKAKEAVLAVKVERKLAKDQILERYLNTVYFGRGAYGVEAAAQTFFGVSAKDLNVEQSAYLTAALKLPSRTEHPDRMLTVRNQVIGTMVTNDKLTNDQAEVAKAKPIQTRARSQGAASGEAAFYLQYVQQEVVRRAPNIDLEGGGYQIYTSYDSEKQKAADQTIKTTLNRAGDPQAALVTLDTDGKIVALYGGSDFAASQVNLATGKSGGGSGRQSGSTFKPIVLSKFLTEGGTLNQTFAAPATIDIPQGSSTWTVRNYEPKDYGNLSVLDATADSTNTVYAQMIEQVGAQGIVDEARALGIESDLPITPAVGLGSGSVSPLEMAAAYSVFMNGGRRIEPTAVTRIQSPSKSSISLPRPKRQSATNEGVAAAVTAALQAVVENGTGKAAAIGRPVAGKTGTTSDYVDAWFVGYTPHLTTAVWVGFPEDASKKMTNVHGIRVSGGTFPAQIFSSYMKTAVKNTKPDDFPESPERYLSGTTTTSNTVEESTTSTTEAESTTTSSTASSSTSTTAPRRSTTSTTSSSSPGRSRPTVEPTS